MLFQRFKKVLQQENLEGVSKIYAYFEDYRHSFGNDFGGFRFYIEYDESQFKKDFIEEFFKNLKTSWGYSFSINTMRKDDDSDRKSDTVVYSIYP